MVETFETITLERSGFALNITLNRATSRNAMSLQMVEEMGQAIARYKDSLDVRAVIFRGAGGNFCAGGDIKDMVKAREAAKHNESAIFELNRAFGHLISNVNQLPQVTICMLEGAVLGGGLGLACVSDIAIAMQDAQFGLPETGLGLPPAQIAPFVVQRLGITQARRLMLTGSRFNGAEAQRLGIAHFCCKDEVSFQDTLQNTLDQINRCGPIANRMTKQLLMNSERLSDELLLNRAAEFFSQAVESEEGAEGTRAFVEKRRASWVVE